MFYPVHNFHKMVGNRKWQIKDMSKEKKADVVEAKKPSALYYYRSDFIYIYPFFSSLFDLSMVILKIKYIQFLIMWKYTLRL